MGSLNGEIVWIRPTNVHFRLTIDQLRECRVYATNSIGGRNVRRVLKTSSMAGGILFGPNRAIETRRGFNTDNARTRIGGRWGGMGYTPHADAHQFRAYFQVGEV